MANSWYGRVKGFLAGTKARGSDVRFEYDALEDAFDNMPAPHSSAPTTKGFSGAVDFEGAVSLSGGLGANADGADTYKLTSMIDGSDSQDYATLANVTAEVAGGGTPSNIPITSLGVGTANADEFIVINSGGTAPEGQTGTTAAALIPVTSLDEGTGTARQHIRVQADGSGLEAFTPKEGENSLLNGDMRVQQQSTTVTSASEPLTNADDTYMYDGWYLLSDGNDVFDISKHTTPADLPDGAYAAMRLDVETISKKGGILQILEASEVSKLFDGGNGTASLSFKAKRTGSAMELKAAVLAWDSTADSVTSDVVSAWGVDGTTPTFVANWTAENTPAALGLSTSYQTFRIENISLNTASTTNVAVFIWVDTTTTNAGEFVYVTDVQLERGSQATEFRYRPYTEELHSCYRWRLLRYRTSATEFIGTGVNISTTHAYINMQPPVVLRVDPTVSNSTASEFRIFEVGAKNVSAITTISINEEMITLDVTGSSLNSGNGALLYINSNTGWILLSSIL